MAYGKKKNTLLLHLNVEELSAACSRKKFCAPRGVLNFELGTEVRLEVSTTTL